MIWATVSICLERCYQVVASSSDSCILVTVDSSGSVYDMVGAKSCFQSFSLNHVIEIVGYFSSAHKPETKSNLTSVRSMLFHKVKRQKM